MVSSSPTLIEPSIKVPVTTVPKPFTEKARSTFKRAGKSSLVSLMLAIFSSKSVFNSSIPSPAIASVSIIGAFSNAVPKNCSLISSNTINFKSSSAPSTLVKTIIKSSIPSKFKTSTCSRV